MATVAAPFAQRMGQWVPKDGEKDPLNTIFAVVQPSEPEGEQSHVRDMLDGHESVVFPGPDARVIPAD